MEYYTDNKEIVVAKIVVSRQELANEIGTRIFKQRIVNQWSQGYDEFLKRGIENFIDFFCFDESDVRIKNGDIVFIGKAKLNKNDTFDFETGKTIAHNKVVLKLNDFKRDIAIAAICFFDSLVSVAEDIAEDYTLKAREKQKFIKEVA